MTDEELAKLIVETHDRLKPMTWVCGEHGDDNPETRYMPRVHEHWTNVVREVRHRLESSRREQTAATILAAVVGTNGAGGWRDASGVLNLDSKSMDHVALAVALADALRAELAKGAR